MAGLGFTGKDNGPTIEEYIKKQKSLWKNNWKWWVLELFREEAATWWGLLNKTKCYNLPDEKFEKLLLDRWSHAKKQDKEKHVALFHTGISLLQVHGLI